MEMNKYQIGKLIVSPMGNFGAIPGEIMWYIEEELYNLDMALSRAKKRSSDEHEIFIIVDYDISKTVSVILKGVVFNEATYGHE
jgi:hypothetical protein